MIRKTGTQIHFWNKIRKSLHVLDLIIIIFCTAMFILLTLLAWQGASTGGKVSIETANGQFVYSLSQDRVIQIKGPIGLTTFEIKDGHFEFVNSPCRDKLCIHSGKLSKNGEWGACMPNKLFARIQSVDTDGLDAKLY